jgi:hypothetical protein
VKTAQVQQLTDNFEACAQKTESGVEYWLARDIQHLLGHAYWRNFNNSAVFKAKTVCEQPGRAPGDHFVGVNKMVALSVAPHPQFAFPTFIDYSSQHIRPLAVRPLNHPERVPNPWGFFVSKPRVMTNPLIRGPL